jgi:hypothetical protein
MLERKATLKAITALILFILSSPLKTGIKAVEAKVMLKITKKSRKKIKLPYSGKASGELVIINPLTIESIDEMMPAIMNQTP